MSSLELKQLHEKLLYMLDAVDGICRENNISYFLDSGTALGAIRNNGFIPWDDDVDIGMLRADYDRFLEVAPLLLPDNLILQNEHNEPHYYLFYTKIRMLNTFFPQSSLYGPEKDFRYRGIQIDIFPFDFVSDNPVEAKKQMDYARWFRLFAEIRLMDSKPKRIIKIPFYYGLRVFPKSFFRNNYDSIIQKNNKSQTNMVASFTYRMARKKNYSFRFDSMLPVKDILFEDRTYMIMNDPDYYLKQMYGDYMKLPPEEERRPHLVGDIVFDLNK